MIASILLFLLCFLPLLCLFATFAVSIGHQTHVLAGKERISYRMALAVTASLFVILSGLAAVVALLAAGDAS